MVWPNPLQAYQTTNPDQFATTTVVLEVKKMSLHPPRFDKDAYEGYISLDAGVDSLVLEGKDSSKPLRVQATDQDFADVSTSDLWPLTSPYVQYICSAHVAQAFIKKGALKYVCLSRELKSGCLWEEVKSVCSEGN